MKAYTLTDRTIYVDGDAYLRVEDHGDEGIYLKGDDEKSHGIHVGLAIPQLIQGLKKAQQHLLVDQEFNDIAIESDDEPYIVLTYSDEGAILKAAEGNTYLHVSLAFDALIAALQAAHQEQA